MHSNVLGDFILGIGWCSDTHERGEMYKVKVYVDHGYYQYEVGSMEAALEHAQVIMGSGVYRHYNDDGHVEFYPVHKVKVAGEELGTKHPDKFCRT